MSKEMLLEPAVKKVFIREVGHTEQEATYLNLEGNLDAEAMDYAVSKGAAYLKKVREYCDKKKKSQSVILTASNKELGLKAITYLAEYNRTHENWDTDQYGSGNDFDIYDDDMVDFLEYDYDYDDESDNRKNENIISAWTESDEKIPIIDQKELISAFSENEWGIPFGGMMGAGGQKNFRDEPYWKSCNHSCVCIVWEDYGIYFGGDDELTALDKAINFFRNNNRVYILRVCEGLVEDQNERGVRSLDELNTRWSKLILNHVIDEVNVCMEKDLMKPYLSSILKAAAQKASITLDKTIDISTIVNTVIEMKDEQKCHYLCKMLEYATKEWDESTERVLGKKDIEPIVKLFVSNFKAQVNPKENLKKNIVGMEEIKEHIHTVINGMKFQKYRKSQGLSEVGYHNVHLMIGAPGTAKTTMAKIMGDMMVEEGLLPGNRFISLNGAELKGQYVGQSAPKTRAIIESNDIIFIDEAYSLVPDNGEADSYSQEVLAQLAVELEKHATDKLFIFAGYGGKNVTKENDKMKKFIDCNPGIKSRINSTIYFDSYSAEQMYAIFANLAKNKGFKLESGIKPLVVSYFATRVNDKNFGNGREARSLFENIIAYMGNRLMDGNKITTEQLSLIKKCDVVAAINKTQKSDSVQNAHANGTVRFTF